MHLAGVVIVLSISDGKAFTVPLTYTGVEYNSVDETLLPNVTCAVREFHPWALVLVFFAASFLSEAWQTLTLFWEDEAQPPSQYRGNPVRWLEYAIGAPAMLCLVAILFGVFDFVSLWLLAIGTAVTMLTGLYTEQSNFPLSQPVSRTSRNARGDAVTPRSIDWSHFVVGSLLSVSSWVFVFVALGTAESSEVPAVAYLALFSFFFFYFSFPAYMVYAFLKMRTELLTVESIGRYENGWTVLSFTSKALLGVFGLLSLTQQPNGGKEFAAAFCDAL